MKLTEIENKHILTENPAIFDRLKDVGNFFTNFLKNRKQGPAQPVVDIPAEQPVSDYQAIPTEVGVFVSKDVPIIKKVKSAYNKLIAKPRKQDVESSWIKTIEYNPRTDQITISTLENRSFVINGTEIEEYLSWLKAQSKGKFFHQHIKPNH